MFKINLKWLEIGTPLFMITYVNVTIFIIHILNPKVLNGINDLLNSITQNLVEKIFGSINLVMILNLYSFYTYLIILCFILFIVSLILMQINISVVYRVEIFLGWLFMLVIHQFNILIIIFMMSESTKFFSPFNIINIVVFILFTYIFFISTDTHEKNNNI